MKTSTFFKAGLLLFAAGIVLTSCGKDDKNPEIVVDPVKEVVEYYIAGKVVTEDAALSGVTVTAGDVTATTDDQGQYSVTVKDKKTYVMTFAKEGYKEINDASATVASNATNRSMVTLNVSMSKEGVAATVDPAKDITVTEKGEGDSKEATAAVAIPAGAVTEEAAITVTPYIAPVNTANETAGTKSEAVAMTNIVVNADKDIVLEKDVELAINNKASETNFFDEVEVYKKEDTNRAAGDWNKMGDATFDKASNSYKVNISKGQKLNGEYSVRVKSDKTVGATQNNEILKEESKSNAGNMSAINGYTINYEAKAGWETTTTPSGIESDMLAMINSTVAAQEGTAGVYTVPQSMVTNISGDYNLYFCCKAKYVEKSYTFSIKGGQKVTIKIKVYVGVEIIYKNESSNTHSGGGTK